MTVIEHQLPANVIGISGNVQSSVKQTLLVHNVEHTIYAQIADIGSLATLVGYVPATSDGFGGISQLARDVDCRFYPQKATGYSASVQGSTLTVNYPAVDVMWDGVVRTLPSGSVSGTVTTGLWSLVVGYNWGLTNLQLVQTANLDSSASYIELCEIQVSVPATTAVVSNGMVGLRLLGGLCVAGPSGAAYTIPTSNSNAVMPG